MRRFGEVGAPNEFFLIKLKDRYSEAALRAYADAAHPNDHEYAAAIAEMAQRAGLNSPFAKPLTDRRKANDERINVNQDRQIPPVNNNLSGRDMMPCMRQSKTYVQIATGLTITVPLAFFLSAPLAATLLVLVAVSLLTGLAFHKHDE